MSEDLGQKVDRFQTEKGLVFSGRILGSQPGYDDWTYSRNGEEHKTSAALVSPEVLSLVKGLYINLKASHEDKSDNHYKEVIGRLIRTARDQGFMGEEGEMLVLTQEDIGYTLRQYSVKKVSEPAVQNQHNNSDSEGLTINSHNSGNDAYSPKSGGKKPSEIPPVPVNTVSHKKAPPEDPLAFLKQ